MLIYIMYDGHCWQFTAEQMWVSRGRGKGKRLAVGAKGRERRRESAEERAKVTKRR